MFNTPEGSKLLRFGSIALIVLAVFLGVQTLFTLLSVGQIGKGIYPTNTIMVSGVGEKIAVPDLATFSFSAQTTSENVASAQKVVTEKMNKALDIIKASGVEEKDIKTTGYNINPHYEYTQPPCTQFSCPGGRQLLTGYDVSQTVEVKVRDTSKAGELLGKLGSVEVSNLSGLSFTVDDEDGLKAEARALAIEDAREKAKALAKNLGVRLGRVVTFNEDMYPQPYYMGGYAKESDMMMDSVAPQLPVGENKIVSNVSVTYELK